MTPEERVAGQVAHIKEHQAAFDKIHLGSRDVAEYFRDYSYKDDLYENVCFDLGIDPKRELLDR